MYCSSSFRRNLVREERKENGLRKEDGYLTLILASRYLTQLGTIERRDLRPVYLTSHKTPGLNCYLGKAGRGT